METIIIEDANKEHAISHPKFGTVRYFMIKGKPYMMRTDVAVAFGLSSSTSSRANDFKPILVLKKWTSAARAAVICIDAEGLKIFSKDGVKNLERRQAVTSWLLESLYGEKVWAPQENLFADAPITLTDAQMDELVERVITRLKSEPLKFSLPDEEQEKFVNDMADKFKNKPITLSDKQQDEIAYKVLALMEGLKPNEEAIADRVLEKFLSKFQFGG